MINLSKYSEMLSVFHTIISTVLAIVVWLYPMRVVSNEHSVELQNFFPIAALLPLWLFLCVVDICARWQRFLSRPRDMDIIDHLIIP